MSGVVNLKQAKRAAERRRYAGLVLDAWDRIVAPLRAPDADAARRQQRDTAADVRRRARDAW